jgi:hypothetical protein
MEILTVASVAVIAILSAHNVIRLALRRKGDVKANMKLGGSSFSIEVKDRR